MVILDNANTFQRRENERDHHQDIQLVSKETCELRTFRQTHSENYLFDYCTTVLPYAYNIFRSWLFSKEQTTYIPTLAASGKEVVTPTPPAVDPRLLVQDIAVIRPKGQINEATARGIETLMRRELRLAGPLNNVPAGVEG